MFNVHLFGHKNYGLKTATGGTPFVQMVEPMRGAWTVIAGLEYINQADAHTLTFMRPLGSTTFAADAAASQAAVVLTADPGNYAATWRTADNLIAAGDYVIYRAADGTYVIDTVASGSGTTPTLTTNLPTLGVLAGAPFWFFGISTDTNPSDAQAHPQMRINPTSSGFGLTRKPDNGASLLIQSFGIYEPLIVYSNNAVSAGYLNSLDVAYTARPGPNVSNAAGTANA